MNEQHNQQTFSLKRYTSIKGELSTKEQMKIFILWKIHNKKMTIGSRIFFNDINSDIGGSRGTYSTVLEFLDGASLVVNEVVIADKVPQKLIERYGLRVEENQSNN